MYLAIDTSTRFAGVALWKEGRLQAALSWHSLENHTRELMPAIEHLLQRTSAGLAEVRGIALAAGPGGFSALRVGMSVAKGLALAQGIPLVSVSTLEAEAYPYAGVGLPVCSLIPAGRTEVATASFGRLRTSSFQSRTAGWRRLKEERLLTIADLAASVTRRTLFCGEAAPQAAGTLGQLLGARAVVIQEHVPSLRLWALARLGAARLERGESEDIATLQPLYLRHPSITPPKAVQPVKQ